MAAADELLRFITHVGEMEEALRWALPREFGGEEVEPLELHLRYEQIARQSLERALILTQRDSAVGIIAASANEATRRRLLEEVRGGAFVTVGIAQLTTSRQGGPPTMRATPVAGGYRIDGNIPWATGASSAKYVIAGAATDEGQVLFPLPTDARGVTIDSPLPLVAMAGTLTSEVRCESVELPKEMVLLGPAANVLSLRRKSVPLPQAFLALGHCRRAVDVIGEHDSDRGRALQLRFAEQVNALHTQVVAACAEGADPALVPLLRGQCNELALRVTHAAVAFYKGSALLMSHPAQQLAREAMFLLVWSCPDPVIDCTVDLLSGGAST